MDQQDGSPNNVESLIDISLYALNLHWKVVFATTSGTNWKQEKAVKKLMVLYSQLYPVSVLPFTRKEAIEYLNDFPVEECFHEDILQHGTIPLILDFHEHSDSTMMLNRNNDCVALFEHDIIDELQLDQKQTTVQFTESIADSLRWLLKAERHEVLLESKLKGFYRSYAAIEHLIFLVEEEKKMDWILELHPQSVQEDDRTTRGDQQVTEECQAEKKFVPFLSFPAILTDLFKVLLNKTKEIPNFCPSLIGFFLESHFFLSGTVRNYSWNVKALNLSDNVEKTLAFSNIHEASHQEKEQLTKKVLQPDILYYFKPGHAAIDGVVKATTGRETYLLLIQISLSNYKSHKSKYLDIESAMPYSKSTILNHYCHLFDVRADNTVYLYLSPNELYSEAGSLESIFAISSVATRSGKSKPRSYSVGLLEKSCSLAAYLESIIKSYHQD